MATTNNVPSDNFEDLLSDVRSITKYMNGDQEFQTRTGQQITPLPAQQSMVENLIRNSGFQPVGNFATGATITAVNQVLFNNADSCYYNWQGAVPFIVPAGTNPTANAGPAAWVNRGNIFNQIIAVSCLKDLGNINAIHGQQFSVAGFYQGSTIDGCNFVYEASKPESEHDGKTIIAARAIQEWDGSHSDISTLINWTGIGSGCFVAPISAGETPFGTTSQVDAIGAGPMIRRPWNTTKPITIFVSVNSGNDKNSGGIDSPLKTINAAIQRLPQNIYHAVRIYLYDGDYSSERVRLFNYFVTARSAPQGAFRIVGHEQNNPLYGDNKPENVILGDMVISGIYGTEETEIRGVTFLNSWCQVYDSYVKVIRCRFIGGQAPYKIPLGGHNSSQVYVLCHFDDVSTCIDAENYVTAAFESCTIGTIVSVNNESGGSIYGRPVVSRNFSTVFLKNSPDFYKLGPNGKNLTQNQSVVSGRLYSHAADNGGVLSRGYDDDYLLLSGGTGANPTNGRGGTIILGGMSRLPSEGVTQGGIKKLIGHTSESREELFHNQGNSEVLIESTRTSGDKYLKGSVSFGSHTGSVEGRLAQGNAVLYVTAEGDVWLAVKHPETGVFKMKQMLDFSAI